MLRTITKYQLKDILEFQNQIDTGLSIFVQSAVSLNNSYGIIIFIDSLLCYFIVGVIKSDENDSSDNPFKTIFMARHC